VVEARGSENKSSPSTPAKGVPGREAVLMSFSSFALLLLPNSPAARPARLNLASRAQPIAHAQYPMPQTFSAADLSTYSPTLHMQV